MSILANRSTPTYVPPKKDTDEKASATSALKFARSIRELGYVAENGSQFAAGGIPAGSTAQQWERDKLIVDQAMAIVTNAALAQLAAVGKAEGTDSKRYHKAWGQVKAFEEHFQRALDAVKVPAASTTPATAAPKSAKA